MDLEQCTSCIFIMWALLIIVCQAEGYGNGNSNGNGNPIETGCGSGSGNGGGGGSVGGTESEIESLRRSFTAYFSHRVFILTALGTLLLTLLGCLGFFCCCCYHWATRKVENLDAYAPRTTSIVWPSLPEETAQVLELTFLHAPGAVDCLCSVCELERKMRCMENCLNASEC